MVRWKKKGWNPIEEGAGAFSFTYILSNSVGMLIPFGELLDQIAQHGRYVANGFRVIVEENLP